MFCLSFLALFLELMVIRWAPAVVRLIAYYANLMLISSFLGLGQFGTWMYAPLIATLLLLYFVKRDSILALTFNERLLWSLLVVPLPIFLPD